MSDITTDDDQRAGRIVIGMMTGDGTAVNTALADANDAAGKQGVLPLILALARLASEVLTAAAGDPLAAVEHLRRSLAALALSATEQPNTDNGGNGNEQKD